MVKEQPGFGQKNVGLPLLRQVWPCQCDISQDLRHEVGVGLILEECFVRGAGTVRLAILRILDDGEEGCLEGLKYVGEVATEIVATSYTRVLTTVSQLTRIWSSCYNDECWCFIEPTSAFGDG